jgi:hypothetical protein
MENKADDLKNYQSHLNTLQAQAEEIARTAPEEVKELAGRLANVIRRMLPLVDSPVLGAAGFDAGYQHSQIVEYGRAVAYTNAAITRELQLLTTLRGRVKEGEVSQSFKKSLFDAETADAANENKAGVHLVLDGIDKRLHAAIAKACAELSSEVLTVAAIESDDWTAKPALFFQILISDSAARENLRVVSAWNRRLMNALDEFQPVIGTRFGIFFNYRSLSEQRTMKDGGQWKAVEPPQPPKKERGPSEWLHPLRPFQLSELEAWLTTHGLTVVQRVELKNILFARGMLRVTDRAFDPGIAPPLPVREPVHYTSALTLAAPSCGESIVSTRDSNQVTCPQCIAFIEAQGRKGRNENVGHM